MMMTGMISGNAAPRAATATSVNFARGFITPTGPQI